MRHGRHTRMLAVAAALLAPGALAVPAQGAARAAGCPDAQLVPSASNLSRIERATLCLVNVQRTTRGLSRLTARTQLEDAAARYARQMVARRFFDHVSPTGSTLTLRVKRSGYLRGVAGWSLGENIAWGMDTLATPRSIVQAWMHSPGHRANILHPRFRDAGIGIAAGAPARVGSALPSATFVNVFGRRVGR